jgi:type III secretory pathway component EscS
MELLDQERFLILRSLLSLMVSLEEAVLEVQQEVLQIQRKLVLVVLTVGVVLAVLTEMHHSQVVMVVVVQ